MNVIYFHFQGLALKVIRCAPVGGFLETRTEGPTGTPVLLLRGRVCDGFKRIWQILLESDRGVYTYRGYGRVPFTLGVEPQPEAHFPCRCPPPSVGGRT